MNSDETLDKKLDLIQTKIWARINDEAHKEGVKLTIGNAYGMGSVIKEVLHPEVNKLLRQARKEGRKQIAQKAIEHKERADFFKPNTKVVLVSHLVWLAGLDEKEMDEVDNE